MYNKYNISHCNQNEINKLNEFKRMNPDKISPDVYYCTDGHLGVGFSLIATFDKPKRKHGRVDFGNCCDITDYDYRLESF